MSKPFEVIDCGQAYELFVARLVRKTLVGPCACLSFANPEPTTGSRTLFMVKTKLYFPQSGLVQLARQLLAPCEPDTNIREWGDEDETPLHLN
jgi:hypothetical protein